jgi:hypothetical protein
MKLLNLQRRMARAVMTPLTSSEGMQRVAANGRRMRDVAAEFIKPNDRLTSFERLEISIVNTGFEFSLDSPRIFPDCAPCLGTADSTQSPKRI